jgi:hypothetical protein
VVVSELVLCSRFRRGFVIFLSKPNEIHFYLILLLVVGV